MPEDCEKVFTIVCEVGVLRKGNNLAGILEISWYNQQQDGRMGVTIARPLHWKQKTACGTRHPYAAHIHFKDTGFWKSGLQPLKRCRGKFWETPVQETEKSPPVHNALLEYHHRIIHHENGVRAERLSTAKSLLHHVFPADDCHHLRVSPALPHSLSAYVYFEPPSRTSHCCSLTSGIHTGSPKSSAAALNVLPVFNSFLSGSALCCRYTLC